MQQFQRVLGLVVVLSMLTACGDGGEKAVQVSPEQIQALKTQSETYKDKTLAELASDPSALTLGQSLYQAHCSSCHNKDAKGESAHGIANLVSGVFNYGDTDDAIRTTISEGRHSVMPEFGSTTRELELTQIAEYIHSLGSTAPATGSGGAAKALFDKNCARCHGEDAKGNSALGAANLTDGYWQYANSTMGIRMNITRGLEAQCPAQKAALSTSEIELLTNYVLQIRKKGSA